MSLDTFDAVYDAHGAVEHWETTVDFKPEILMAWGIDEIDDSGMNPRRAIGCRRPMEGDGCGLDGDSLLSFKFEEVCYGTSLVNS